MMVIAVATQWPRLRQVSTHTRTVLLYGGVRDLGRSTVLLQCRATSFGRRRIASRVPCTDHRHRVGVDNQGRTSERADASRCGGGLIGAAVVIDVFGSAEISAVGVAWGLAAAACLAVYFVISERADGDLHPVVLAASGGLTVSAVVIGALGLVGVLPLQFSASNAVVADHSVNVWLPVVVLVLVSTVIAYLTGIAAITLLGGPTIGSLVALTEVLCAVVAAWILVGGIRHRTPSCRWRSNHRGGWSSRASVRLHRNRYRPTR